MTWNSIRRNLATYEMTMSTTTTKATEFLFFFFLHGGCQLNRITRRKEFELDVMRVDDLVRHTVNNNSSSSSTKRLLLFRPRPNEQCASRWLSGHSFISFCKCKRKRKEEKRISLLVAGTHSKEAERGHFHDGNFYNSAPID